MAGILKEAPSLVILAVAVACGPMARAASPNAAAPAPAQAAPPTGAAQVNAERSVSSQDESFVRTAAEAGMSEVKEGELAMHKSPYPAIREFGRWMMTDHTEIGQFLTSQARAAGITVPASISESQQSLYDRLQKMSGSEFDKHYINHQVQAHEQAVALFKTEASSGTDPGLRTLAERVMPVLEQHLAEAQNLQKLLPRMSAQR